MKNVFLAATVMALLCTTPTNGQITTNFTAENPYDAGILLPRSPVLRHSQSSVVELVKSQARRQGVPVSFALAIANHESKFRCSAIGSHGERGVMQIKPATARGIGYKGTARGLNDCAIGVYWGMKYLKMALVQAHGDLKKAAFLYNAGLGARTKNPSKRPYVVALMKKGLSFDD